MNRYLVTLTIDVDANNFEQAVSQAISTVVSAGRLDGFDANVELLSGEEPDDDSLPTNTTQITHGSQSEQHD